MTETTKKKPVASAKPEKAEPEEEKLSAKDEQNITIIERVIETREIQPHEAFGKLSRAQVELIKRTVAKDATDDELKLFLAVCHGAKLNPFLRQVHLVKRWDKKTGREVGTIQVGIDGFRATAEQTGAYAGSDDVVYEGEKTLNIAGKEITVPDKATVTVHKVVAGQRYPFTATARWDEYYPGERTGFQWHARPYLMLGKCGEALALRKGFPSQLSGIYTPEEMSQANTETNEAKQQQANFKQLTDMVKTMTPGQLREYRKKMEISEKYTPEQKKAFTELVDARITDLTAPEEEK